MHNDDHVKFTQLERESSAGAETIYAHTNASGQSTIWADNTYSLMGSGCQSVVACELVSLLDATETTLCCGLRLTRRSARMVGSSVWWWQ